VCSSGIDIAISEVGERERAIAGTLTPLTAAAAAAAAAE